MERHLQEHARRRHAQERLGHDQVPGARDREELGQPLDEPQDQRVDVAHASRIRR